MKIKRYVASSMRAALGQARTELGPDAVILSNRRTEDGIEVIAAVDYDEGLFAEVSRPRASATATAAPTANTTSATRATPVAEPAAAPAAVAAAPRAAAATRVPTPAPVAAFAASLAADGRPVAASPVPSAPASTQVHDPASPALATSTDVDVLAMQRELAGLRRLLETGLAGLTFSNRRPQDPLKLRVLEQLLAMDIAHDVAAALAADTPLRFGMQNPAHVPLALLLKHLPVVDDLATVTGGVVAIVGPTGAGKTTTIAKLASRWCMRHGNHDLALVSTDGYRIGARDQLSSYARLLGAPMHAANSGADLSRLLDRLQTKKLVLIDTAGMGPRDARLSEQLSALRSGAPAARVLLALPAQGEGHALEEIVRSFARAAPSACVLTKVDEAASLGGVISAALRHRLNIAYVCDGQRVPEDLQTALQMRVWLVRRAAALKSDRVAPLDPAAFAHPIGGAPAHV